MFHESLSRGSELCFPTALIQLTARISKYWTEDAGVSHRLCKRHRTCYATEHAHLPWI